MQNTIIHKVQTKQAIDIKEAAWLFQNADDELLKNLATKTKSRFHSLDQPTYVIMAILNYTNVCVAGCDYCAFFKYPHEKGAYVIDVDTMSEKIRQCLALDANMVGFNGGFHPKLTLKDHAEYFSVLHERFPELTFYEMTVAEFLYYCKKDKVSFAEGAELLYAAGTRWISGGGAEILQDDFRFRHSPGKFKVSDYYAAQQAILDVGMGSTATMVIGFDETLEERLEHLEMLRGFQDRQVSNKLVSLLMWTYKPYNNKLGGKEISHGEYLRWLAVCRIYLHNFEHFRTSVLTQNENAFQGFHYGADDFDLPLEDEVTQKAGAIVDENLSHVLSHIKELGMKPNFRKPWSHN